MILLLFLLLCSFHSIHSTLPTPSHWAHDVFCPVTFFGLSLELLTAPSYLCLFSMTPHLCLSLAAWLFEYLPVLLLASSKWVHSQPPTVCSVSLLWPWINGCSTPASHPQFFFELGICHHWSHAGRVYPFPRFVRDPRALVFAQKVMPYEAYHPNTDRFNVIN